MSSTSRTKWDLHLTRGQQPDDGRSRLYIVNEASIVSTRQMHALLERLNRYDRVLFVGDVWQHEAVEAGRPYAQMREAGLRMAPLDEILRQKDPVLKETVEQLARGEVKQAIEILNYQGRVHEFKDRGERLGGGGRFFVVARGTEASGPLPGAAYPLLRCQSWVCASLR